MTANGDTVLMIPLSDGHYSFIPIPDPQAGDRCLIYPSHSGEYYLLPIASVLVPGKSVIIVPDYRGTYWPISSKSSSGYIPPSDDTEEEEEPEEEIPDTSPEIIPIIVAGDGTGNYNCDGIDDQVEINQALYYAYRNPGTVIHLKGPFTYTISDSLLIYTNTILEGDSTAVIKLKANCGFVHDQPMIKHANPARATKGYIKIRGFEIDGNADNNTQVSRGKGYHTLAWLYYDDIEFHDMYLHDSNNDGLKVMYSESVKFYKNRVYKLGHDVVFAQKCNGVLFYNNNVRTKTNAAIRFYNSNGKAYDNFIWTVLETDAGGPGIQIQYTRESTAQPMNNIEIYHNTFQDCYGPGIWLIGTGDYQYEAYEADGVHIHHNLFYGCGAQSTYEWLAGITTSGFYNTLIEYNTFDACYNAGVAYIYPSGVGPNGDVTPYTATVRNNIFSNMLLRKASPSGTGQAVQNNYPASASFTIENNCCYGNAGTNYVGCSATGDVLADPLYVDRTNHDYHLQTGSPAEGMGRYAGE